MSMYGHENYPRGNTSFFVVMLWIIDPRWKEAQDIDCLESSVHTTQL